MKEVDIGLPWSTEEDRQCLACATEHRLHPPHSDLELVAGPYNDGRSRWYDYKVVMQKPIAPIFKS